MIEKLLKRVPGIGSEEDDSEEFNPTRGEDYELDPNRFKDNEKVDIKDLSPGEQLKLIILNFVTSKEKLKDKWVNDQIEIYFLFFSVIGALAMLLSIRYGSIITTSILFAAYAAIAIPTLYAYEETGLIEKHQQSNQTPPNNINSQDQEED